MPEPSELKLALEYRRASAVGRRIGKDGPRGRVVHGWWSPWPGYRLIRVLGAAGVWVVASQVADRLACASALPSTPLLAPMYFSFIFLSCQYGLNEAFLGLSDRHTGAAENFMARPRAERDV